MHRKSGKGSRKHSSSSERRFRTGLGIPFLLNSESKEPSSMSQSSREPGSSQHTRRSSFDRSRTPHHREPRPVPMQDTSPPYSIESRSMADFRSHMSMSSSSNMASTPAEEISMSTDQDPSFTSMSVSFPGDAAEVTKPRKGDIRCLKCDKTFFTVEEMQKHDSESHLKARVRTFECPVCHLTFKDQSNANKHFRAVHEGKRRGVECGYCGKQLSGQESLVRHMKNIHHNIRDVPCPHCGRKFKQGAHMRKHVETQHGDLRSRHPRSGRFRRDSDVDRSSRASSSRGVR